MTFIQEFPAGVIEKLEYYVYLLIDPETDQVFYVGKGVGNRIFAHLNAAIADETPSDKLDKIRAIRAKGLEVNHIVHRHGLTEKEAFEVEAALIDYITLSELTNQVQGYNSDDRGRMNVAEVIAMYQAPVAEITEPVILITINRLFRRGMSAEELYEVTRGKWAIGTRRNKAKYAFAVNKGIIREVYGIERWLPAQIGDDEVNRGWISADAVNSEVKQRQRWQFEGKIADSLKHYVGGSTEMYAVVGAQNPIRYVNC
ncbi:MAG: hypothetical protein WKF74_01305 [Pyrinomonadaceae bacterium]